VEARLPSHGGNHDKPITKRLNGSPESVCLRQPSVLSPVGSPFISTSNRKDYKMLIVTGKHKKQLENFVKEKQIEIIDKLGEIISEMPFVKTLTEKFFNFYENRDLNYRIVDKIDEKIASHIANKFIEKHADDLMSLIKTDTLDKLILNKIAQRITEVSDSYRRSF